MKSAVRGDGNTLSVSATVYGSRGTAVIPSLVYDSARLTPCAILVQPSANSCQTLCRPTASRLVLW